MSNISFKRITACILALLLLIPFVSCGTDEKDTDESVSEKNTEEILNTEIGIYTNENAAEFLKKYSDYDAAEKWLEENIKGTDVPPVNFTVGDKNARELKWSKETGEPYEITDFPNTESPVKRTCREIKYTCAEEQIMVKITLTTYPNYPVAEMTADLINLSPENSKEIKDLYAYSTADAASGYTVHYNYGSRNTPDDFKVCTDELTEGDPFVIKNEIGLPSCEYLPYIDLENNDKNGGVIIALNWQGDWATNFEISNGKLIISAGENGTDFVMLGNESFKSMGTVLMFYKGGDWQFGQNVWRRWLIEHNLMRNTGRRDFKQNVYICSDFSGYESDMEAIDKIVARGDIVGKYNCVFELDAGWYNCGRDWPHTGDYSPDPKLYPDNTLAELSKKCADNGIGFCLWMEPERFYMSTPQALGLDKENTLKIKGTNQLLVKYGTKEAQDYMTSLIDGVVKDYGLTVYRQDFNTNNRPYWDPNDEKEAEKYGVPRTGATQSHACEGYINTWMRVSELNPGLIFDSCAAGGRRMDIETVRFSFSHTKSDNWSNANGAQCQNFAIYSWLPFAGTGFADVRDQYDVRTRLTASIGVEYKINDKTAAALEEWASLQKYMYNDYYQLTDYSMKNTVRLAMQFDDYENNEGMAIAYLRTGGNYTVKFKGLKADKTYKIYDKDNPEETYTMNGADMMENGLEVSRDKKRAYAVVLFYEEV